jgi:hypothetical protein
MHAERLAEKLRGPQRVFPQRPLRLFALAAQDKKLKIERLM